MPWNSIILLTLLLFSSQQAVSQVVGNSEQQKQWMQLRNEDLSNDRLPSLYTGDFGDCMANSMVKLTQFNAAYYQDNLTVVFHLDGHTSLLNESLMVYIAFFAYGKRRFDLVFDPCNANIHSLCPMNSSRRIVDGGFIPVAPADVSNISPLAFRIPDFEGRAVIRLFSNSTQSQIACYVSTMTNGITLSHPQVVGSILALLISATFVLSLATIIYGEDIANMQARYSHSSSLLVTFTVLHHVYFTGAVSANWPRVLVAFWSNFAPFAGMIYSRSIQSSINRMVGEDKGDLRVLGSRPVGTVSPNLGGYNITDIYGSFASGRRSEVLDTGKWADAVEQNYRISAHSVSSQPETFQWRGQLVENGFPIPGNYSGFAGTLAMQKIPAVNAFTTGLLWFIVLVAILISVIPAVKLTIELLIRCNAIKGRRVENLAYLRIHWLEYISGMILRSLFIGFGMLMFLALFQFGFGGALPSKALAAITFLILLIGSVSITGYVISYRNSHFTVIQERSNLVFERKNLLKIIPWFVLIRKGGVASKETPTALPIYPWWKTCIHDPGSGEARFFLRFGWLVARFKDDRWHFCVIWLMHEFLRACFLGGAIANPISQTIGLLILEIIFMVCAIAMSPFEAKRLSVVLYALSFSNISSVLLSIPLLTQHNLNRLATFAIGMVIVFIQSLLVALLVLSMLTGIVTSYISLTRRQGIPVNQHPSHQIRLGFLEHVDRGVNSRSGPHLCTPSSISPPSRETGFIVHSVRRCPKIIDESPTPYYRNPSTPTSSRHPLHPLSAPSFPTLDPFMPSTSTGSAIPSSQNTHSTNPFNTTATHCVSSGLQRMESLGRCGACFKSLNGDLYKMASLETVLSRSTTGQETSQDDSLCLTDTFETARSDFDPLTEFVTPEDIDAQDTSYSKF
ncbi:hypothetical protein MferCBS31731_001514 [Microsporum ferrugineum]